MNAVILEKCFKYFTNMRIILEPIERSVAKYNWLITDFECNHYPDDRITMDQEYAWLSGQELLEIVENYEIQFIWAVFSAFPKDVPLDIAVLSELPYADGNPRFWQNPVTVQHPLAIMEIVAWDSTLMLLITKDQVVMDAFVQHFPFAKNLEEQNAQRSR